VLGHAHPVKVLLCGLLGGKTTTPGTAAESEGQMRLM
jgi:hypothetical protein